MEGNRALLISKYALDCQQYHSSYTDVTWETCSLRSWLNDTFLNDAFGANHQEIIATTTVSADKNPEYDTNPGNATNDKVFLLSIDEAEKYFSSDSDRVCQPTKYAVAEGNSGNGYKGNCWWWLRSPGFFQDHAADVRHDGSIYCPGNTYISNQTSTDAVRPALWINLE